MRATPSRCIIPGPAKPGNIRMSVMRVRPEPSPPRTSVNKKIAVLGTGACGLCHAKYLVQSGFDVTIFEIGSQIGGLWCYENDNGRSSAYKTLHINTSRGITHFHDLDFDDRTQYFPDHEDMHRYLVSYAEHFDLVKRVRFNTRVVDIRPRFDPAKEPPRLRHRLHRLRDGPDRHDRSAVRASIVARPVLASGRLAGPRRRRLA